MDWIRDSKVKSPDELMVLYSILAASTNYSTRPSKDEEGKLFFEIVEQAVEESKNDPGVMLVQTHLFLGFYLLAGVDPGNGWEECATAGRMAMKLKMNSEQHITALDNQDLSRFGLGPSTFVECKRRTFWGAYLMDVSVLSSSTDGRTYSL